MYIYILDILLLFEIVTYRIRLIYLSTLNPIEWFGLAEIQPLKKRRKLDVFLLPVARGT
jgi:hypothetical protein